MSGTMDGSDTFLWVGGSGSTTIPTNWQDLSNPSFTADPPGPMNTLIFNSGDISDPISAYKVVVTGSVTLDTLSATTADISGSVTTDGFQATADISGMLTTTGGDIFGGTVSAGGTVDATTTAAGGAILFLSSLDVSGDISTYGYLSIAAGQVTVSKGGSIVNTGTSLNTYVQQFATLDVSGGEVTLDSQGFIVRGLLDVQGTGSELSERSTFVVGYLTGDHATVDLTNGGSIFDNYFYSCEGTSALVAINDATLESSSETVIFSGSTVDITNGGTFSSDEAASIGEQGGSTNTTTTVDVAGNGSLFEGFGDVWQGATIVASNGALLSTKDVDIDSYGDEYASDDDIGPALVRVSSGATLDSEAIISVGLATLDVAGGILNCETLSIGTDHYVRNDNALVTVSGNAARWTDAETINVGSVADGTLSLSNGAIVTVADDVVAGGGTNGDGLITLTGNGTQFTVDGDLTIGKLAAGTLTWSDGATITVEGALEVGSATATGTVSGDADPRFGSLAINNGIATIGPGPANAWQVTLGQKQEVEVGADAGATGTLVLTETATLDAGGGEVTIGGKGTGIVTLASLSLFDASADEVTLGDEDGSSGTVDVAGQDAQFQAATLTIGDQGEGDFSVADGGVLTVSGTLTVGDSTEPPVAAILTLADSGSTAQAAALSVGDSGAGTLLVDGAFLSVSGDGSIGGEAGGDGTVTLDTGSINVGGTLTVGESGTGMLMIGAGGTLSAGSVEIAETGDSTGEIDVDGPGSKLSSSEITLGGGGTATLKITDSLVTTSGNVDIADQGQAGTETATIDQLSNWIVGGVLTVGDAGDGSVDITGGSLVTVNGETSIGDQQQSTGTLSVSGSVAIPGSASLFSFADALKIGNDGDGTLIVRQAGTVAATAMGLGEIDIAADAGASGTATIDGAGSLLQGKSLAVSGDITSAGGAGTLDVTDGGVVSVSTAHVWNGGVIFLSGGALDATRVSLDAGATLDGAGDVTASVIDAGLLAAAGGALMVAGPLSGSGAVLVNDGATLDLPADAASTIGGLTIDPGGFLANPGGITVAQSYVNAAFGAGNDFDAHAGISGDGAVDGAGAALAVTGGDVFEGATTTPTVDLSQQADGTWTGSFAVENTGSGAAVIGALQTAGLSDAIVTGLTAENFTVGAGASTQTYTLTYDPSRGDLTGQYIFIQSEFDNVAPITVSLAAGTSDSGGGATTIADVTDSDGREHAVLLGSSVLAALASPLLAGVSASAALFADAPGLVAMTSEEAAAIDDSTGAVTLTGGSAPDETIVASAGAFAFQGGAGGGGTVIAGAGADSLYFPGGGNWSTYLGNGADTVVAATGNDTVSTGTGGSFVFLGAGVSSVGSAGADTILGGTGGETIAATGANGDEVFSLGAPLQFIAGTGASTVVAGAVAATIFGGASGGSLVFTDGATDYTGGGATDTVVGLDGSLTVQGGAGGGLFFGGAAGDNLITAGAGNVTAFGGGAGDVLTATGSADDLFAGGVGAETLTGAGSTGSNTFFAGFGPETLIGGAGNTALVAGAGADLLSGGSGLTLFLFVAGRTVGAADTIAGFDPAHDFVKLAGYSASEASVVANATTANGSATIALSDGTQVTFAGVGQLNAASFT